jgi:hypothetical protein
MARGAFLILFLREVYNVEIIDPWRTAVVAAPKT